MKRAEASTRRESPARSSGRAVHGLSSQLVARKKVRERERERERERRKDLQVQHITYTTMARLDAMKVRSSSSRSNGMDRQGREREKGCGRRCWWVRIERAGGRAGGGDKREGCGNKGKASARGISWSRKLS